MFSKTKGYTYATLLHHPLLFGEIQRSAQEVAIDIPQVIEMIRDPNQLTHVRLSCEMG